MAEAFDFDLIVIGAGSGGVRAGRIAAGHGARVAVIEGDRPGGTCVIRGCVPKKLLVYGASFSADAQDAAGFGWQLGPLQHDWPALIAAKNAETARLEGIYRSLLKNAGVTLIEGWGRLAGPHAVDVAGKIHTARTILIAVGGRPSMPPGIQGLAAHAVTSDGALDLPERPESIVIFGSGFIALEFAGIFNGFGSRVDLVFRSDLPLRGFDDDLRRQISTALSQRGITLHSGRVVKSVSTAGTGYQVTLDDGSIIRADKVMAATGRAPNTRDLGLAEVGVRMNERGAVLVNDYCQSSVDSVYALGDVTDRINLTPVAIAQGHAFADSLFGNRVRTASLENVPCAVFSQPPVACVGLTEAEATERHGPPAIYESRFRAMKNTISGRPEQTYMKLIVNRSDNRVVGVHMVGPDAAEIMQGMAIAVKMGATKDDFDSVVGIHPTAAEEFVTMRAVRQT